MVVAEEWKQKPLFGGLVVPDWDRECQLNFRHELLEGKSQHIECQVLSGTDRWISASFTPIRDSTGSIQKIMMLGTDISEKKNAEINFRIQAEAIMEQEEKLRAYTTELENLQQGLKEKMNDIVAEKAKNEAILEGCVDGVISFNEEGIIEFANKAAEEICDIPHYDLIRQRIQKVISLEIQQTEGEPIIYFSKNGNRRMLDIRTEVPLNTTSGVETEALLTITKVRLADGFIFTAFIQKVSVELF